MDRIGTEVLSHRELDAVAIFAIRADFCDLIYKILELDFLKEGINLIL